MNYGALGLATLCEVNGLDTLMVHGEHEHPSALVQRLHQQGRISADTQVLLSIPSFYALEWSRLFCEAVKRADRGHGLWSVDVGSQVRTRLGCRECCRTRI